MVHGFLAAGKIPAFILMIGGLCWAYVWRHDPGEGPAMQAIGAVAAIAGFFVYLEALKSEIIAEVKNAARTTPPNGDQNK